jgi:hypothetical protein
MKRILIILTVGVLSFGLGWWTSDMGKFANSVITNGQRLDSLKKSNTLSADSLKITQTKLSKQKTIRDYISDDQFIRWRPNHSDTTSYMCEITLHKITALYWYHGQCGYDYFTYLTSDKTIDVLWSYRSDCLLNMAFLEKSNGIKRYPKRGDKFATLTLVNDTTLSVKYNFPEWTKKVNEIAKDSLFPTYHYLQKTIDNNIQNSKAR